MERIFNPMVTQRTYDVFDGKGTWRIYETVRQDNEFPNYPFKLMTGITSHKIFATLHECVDEIKRLCKPPFVELTLKDFRLVVPESKRTIHWLVAESKYDFYLDALTGDFVWNFGNFISAAGVIAAINEKRRKEYDANR